MQETMLSRSDVNLKIFLKFFIFSWNILLAKYGTDLFTYRQKFIQEINYFNPFIITH